MASEELQNIYGVHISLFLILYWDVWRKGSKPVVCRLLDIELEAQTGERG